MADKASILSRVRVELGDFGTDFRDVFLGTGELDAYDLSAINTANVTVRARVGNVSTPLVAGQDYTLDSRAGRILLRGSYAPLADGTELIVEGAGGGMFADADLEQLLTEAFLQHTNGRTTRTRYRDEHGFIRFRDEAVTLDTLPPVEGLPVALLVVINALWVLSTDAAGDVDVDTPDGTHVNRQQRYEQLIHQLGLVQDRYDDLCRQLGVGLSRIEMFDLRRVSRTTGRLVPIFKAQEYDDHSLPTRKIPSVDSREEDDSGVPSVAYWGWW
ncbi:hypothetical protein ACFYP4_02605 [Streptomyces sp. NPDC005551]|uniref:hypothetical protein n=1 Tax=Streptomyces sp. NPDC005551 TaxID=3364725 RepID=UPI0036843ECE